MFPITIKERPIDRPFKNSVNIGDRVYFQLFFGSDERTVLCMIINFNDDKSCGTAKIIEVLDEPRSLGITYQTEFGQTFTFETINISRLAN